MSRNATNAKLVQVMGVKQQGITSDITSFDPDLCRSM